MVDGTCNVCHKKTLVDLEPTIGMLLHGNPRYAFPNEYICNKCSKKRSKRIGKLLDRLFNKKENND